MYLILFAWLLLEYTFHYSQYFVVAPVLLGWSNPAGIVLHYRTPILKLVCDAFRCQVVAFTFWLLRVVRNRFDSKEPTILRSSFIASWLCSYLISKPSVLQTQFGPRVI